MADREKVIDGLEHCRRGPIGCQQECPYKSDFGCRSQLTADALELLKEQEAKKNVYTWICPECGSQIILKTYKANETIGMNFDCCPGCGKKVLYGKAD